MIDRIGRILKRLERQKGAVLYGLVATATIFFIGTAGRSHSTGFKSVGDRMIEKGGQVARTVMPSGVALTGELSQTMLAQAADGRVYLSLAVAVPDMPCEGKSCSANRPTDTVIILDRSGSMSADNRLPFAKRAIHGLIDRLQPQDRIGIVAFDSSAEIISPLTFLTKETKSALHQSVDLVAPGSGTNMSQGMEIGRSLLASVHGERAQKVILLSDGEANEGIVEPQQLAKLASTVNQRSASFSTIGMGLGFNEQLMANLADWGGGSFSYLEHLETLGTILDKNLKDARRLYASTSAIELRLSPEIRLVDAAGYPIERSSDAVTIPFGELLSASKKSAILTLELPTDRIHSHSLGGVSLRFRNNDGEHVVGLPSDVLKISVVDARRKAEISASINSDLYRQSWVSNNLGSLQQSIQKDLSRGDVSSAKASIAQYEGALGNASAAAAVDLASPEVKAKLDGMRAEIEEASKGSGAEQEEKRNRLGKRYLYEGKTNQRSSSY